MTLVFLQLPITVRAFRHRSRLSLSVAPPFGIGVPHELRRRHDLLCPLLTSARRSAHLSARSVACATPNRSPEVISAAFHAQPPDLRSACLMGMDFAITRPLVPCSRLASGFCSSARAFAPRFFQTPLAAAGPAVLLPLAPLRVLCKVSPPNSGPMTA